MNVSEEVIVTIDQKLNLLSLIATMFKYRQLIVMHVTRPMRLSTCHNFKDKLKGRHLLQMILKSEYSLVKLEFLFSNRTTKDLC